MPTVAGILLALALGAEAAPPLTPVPFSAVRIADSYFAPRRDVCRRVSLPHSLDMLERAGNLHNLDLAAAGKREGYRGPVFMDSDLYKVVEAVSCSLATDPDPALEARLDGVIARIAAAQQQDGYLDSWYQVNAPDRRFTNLRDDHELYCAGHLIEAAVAHARATGKQTLLDVARRLADLLCATFGAGPGQRDGYCGHPEIELALIKLADLTGEARYFDLARHFVDRRGTGFFAREHGVPLAEYDGGYWQDNCPVREQAGVVGHAVRYGYLMAAAADVAARTGDADLWRMLKRTWRATAERNTFVTGGIGPSGSNEGFTHDYDLPTATAYQETCATIALAMWSHRMNLALREGKYADAVETALMNGVLAGVAEDGERFFYVNPLESRGEHHRPEWFSCACCPPNVARTLAALGGYAYATSATGLWVNLYLAGSVETEVGGQRVALEVAGDYPWDGRVRFTFRSDVELDLHLRIPAWCAGAEVAVNGSPAGGAHRSRGYLELRRAFRAGDVVELALDLAVRRVQAHPAAAALTGRTALARGPLIYCLEQCDQAAPLERVFAPLEAEFRAERRPDLLGGVVALAGEGRLGGPAVWPGGLYRSAPAPERTPLLAVPYALWDNRAAGAMQVWLPLAPAPPLAPALERAAAVRVSFRNWNSEPEAIRDGLEPAASGEQPATLCHWWDHEGGAEWVEYQWPEPVRIAGARVYWFDDTGRGACRLPAHWSLLADAGGKWVPLGAGADFPLALDRWCEVRFPAVATTRLRLQVGMRDGFAAGVHEWQVIEAEPEDE